MLWVEKKVVHDVNVLFSCGVSLVIRLLTRLILCKPISSFKIVTGGGSFEHGPCKDSYFSEARLAILLHSRRDSCSTRWRLRKPSITRSLDRAQIRSAQRKMVIPTSTTMSEPQDTLKSWSILIKGTAPPPLLANA